MASSARFIMRRQMSGTALNVSTTTSVSQTATNVTVGTEATLRLINNLVFAQSKSVRTSTIILAVFNVLASAATAGSILYDCYWASKRCNPKFKASKFCMSSIHPAEIFPLILAIGIVIQGVMFAVSQSQGLTGLVIEGCSTIAQFMWPAIMIVPYIQVVFGLECALRSIRKTPFQARGKYEITICVGVIVMMLVATWVPSYIFPEHNICFASLVWFVSRYGEAGLIILSTVGGILMISAITIFTRLSKVSMIDEHQRIAASRMVYYLVLGMISLAFVIPYFASMTLRHINLISKQKMAMMATVVLNLSGLMSGLLHLFLRANTTTSAFGPKNGRHWDRTKHEIRIWGPNELAFSEHLVDPVSGPSTPSGKVEVRSDSRASLLETEKDRIISLDLLGSQSYSPPNVGSLALNPRHANQKAIMPTVPHLVVEPSTTSRGYLPRNNSYSLFPNNASSPTQRSPQTDESVASIYDISSLAPPPAIFGSEASRHRRNSSISSSATVQIGLRLSHAPNQSMEEPPNWPLPKTAYGALPATTFSATAAKPIAPIPLSAFNANKPSPLRLQTENLPKPEIPMRSPKRPSPLSVSVTSPIPSMPAASKNKLLPPAPAKLPSVTRESNTVLSPAVYTPEKRIPVSPKTVTIPPSATNPYSPLRNSPLGNGSPTRAVRSTSRKQPPTSQSDWI